MTDIFHTRGHLDPQRDAAIFAPRPEGEDILRMVRQSMVSSYIALMGPRQTGKTSLLYQIKARLQKTPGYATALLDLSPLEGQTDESECYRYICRQLLGEVGNLIPMTDEERKRLANTSEAVDFRGFLSEGAKRVTQARLVVLLDEIGALNPKIADRFFSILRSIFSSRDKESEREFQKYIFIFAGAIDLFQLTAEVVSPLNICERVYLGDLDLAGVRFLVRNLQRLEARVSPGTAARVSAWAGGHPYLTQRICSILEHQLNREAGETGSQGVEELGSWGDGETGAGTPQSDIRAPQSAIRTLKCTPAKVDAAAAALLAGDDNLAYVLKQLQRYPEGFAWIRRFIRRGQKVRFSRVNPTQARLELMGIIKGVDGYCAVRNRLYEVVLSSYLEDAAVPMEDADVETLRRQLASHRSNLSRLEETRAKMGLDARPALLNEIAHEEAEIKRIKERLGEP